MRFLFLTLILAACGSDTTSQTSSPPPAGEPTAAPIAPAPTEAAAPSCDDGDVEACVALVRGGDPAVQRAAIAQLIGNCRTVSHNEREANPACRAVSEIYRSEDIVIAPQEPLPPRDTPPRLTADDDDGYFVSAAGLPAIRSDGLEVAEFDTGDRGEWSEASSITFSTAAQPGTAGFSFPRPDDEELTSAGRARLRRVVPADVARANARLEAGEFRSLFRVAHPDSGFSEDQASPFVLVWWVDDGTPTVVHWMVRRRGPGPIARRGTMNVTLNEDPCAQALHGLSGWYDPPTDALILGRTIGEREPSDDCDDFDGYESALLPPPG